MASDLAASAALNANRLQVYLQGKIDGFGTIQSIRKFSDGQSNPTFVMETEREKLVLRKKPDGPILPSAHAVEREFRVISALHETAVPVPKALHLCEDPEILGTPFYVMSHVEGRTFWDPALPELAPTARSTAYRAMNQTLASLHNVDVDAIGLSDFGKPGSYFERQFGRWSQQYRASETEHMPDMEAVMTWLADNMVPDDGRVALVHGDFRLDNMIFAPDGSKVQALLDWELCTLGHPFADVAYQMALWGMAPDSALRGLAGVDRRSQGLPEDQEYLDAYCRATNVSGIDNWTFYLVFSLFRMAAIVQGVKKRALDGSASSTRALEVGALAGPLTARAVHILSDEKR